jgi:hypothetical protein
MPSQGHTVLFFLLLLFLSSWHIDHGRNDSTVSRAAMVAAIVEDGTLRIDRFQELTGDKSLVNGHYYSDKAPLPALLLVPIYWTILKTGLYDPIDQALLDGPLIMLGGFFTASLPFALLVTLAWRRCASTTSRWPTLTTVGAFVGSFLFAYTGNFNAHLLAACLLVLALIGWERERYVLCGACSAAAVSCEYPLLLFPAFWIVLLFRGQGPMQRRVTHAARFVLGGLPVLLLLLVYNTTITGNPLAIGYQHEANYAFMADGFGFTYPKLDALWGLTFSSYRGLFVYAPVVIALLVPWIALRPTFGMMLRSPVVIPSMLLLLLISAYAMWWGGWSFGPRHLIGVAAVLLYRGLPLLRTNHIARVLLVPLTVFGLFLSLGALSTVGSSFPTEIREPITERILPAIAAGRWSDAQWPLVLGWSSGTCAAVFLVVVLLTFLVCWKLDRRLA